MLLRLFLPLLLLLNGYAIDSQSQNIAPPFSNKIELRFGPGLLKDSGKVFFSPVQYILYSAPQAEVKRPVNGNLSFTFKSDKPTYVNFTDLLNVKKKGNYLTEPGDDVVITARGERFIFSGKGAEKYQLQYLLDSVDANVTHTNPKRGLKAYYLDSLSEYFAWTDFYLRKMVKASSVLNRFKGKVSEYSFSVIADGYISEIIGSLKSKFHSLKDYGLANKPVAKETLAAVYDTSYSKAMQLCLQHAIHKDRVGLILQEHQIQRTFSFDKLRLPSQAELDVTLFKDALNVYKAEDRESFLVNGLPEIMTKVKFNPVVEEILSAYYNEPAFPEWKKWMKEQELKARVNALYFKAPAFTLTDAKGRLVTNESLKGKLVTLIFQGSDENAVRTSDLLMERIIRQFRDHPDAVFVYISTEKNNELWQKQVASSRNKASNIIHASTGGLGTEHPVIRNYAVTAYPTIWVVDISGKVANAYPKIDFSKDNGEQLSAFIKQKIDDHKAADQKKLSIAKDGPYVFYDANTSIAYSIDNEQVSKQTTAMGKSLLLKVQTDLDKTFMVGLQPALTVQPAIYPPVEKLIAFSDIEGNFDAFRKLLQSNKVIDADFNWIFGKGHLVFAGDMFDRGDQVTECLWLIYALEEKAKAAGGYVHFVLGNHEIMNMQGYHAYTSDKYKKNAALLGKTLTELYNEDSEIGKWLRTKNVIEKIGNLLFLHGGISPEVNRSGLSIEKINSIVRPFYGSKVDSSNTSLLMLYDSRRGEGYRISPFWSRAYYKGSRISDSQLDSTLHNFGVQKIITGHTIVADTISVHYGGKVINTDTDHRKGKSEALLIEGDHFYRVNAEGKRVLLFIDDKKKTQLKTN